MHIYFCRKRKSDEVAESIGNRLAKLAKQMDLPLVDNNVLLPDSELNTLEKHNYTRQVKKEITQNEQSDASVPSITIYCGKNKFK